MAVAVAMEKSILVVAMAMAMVVFMAEGQEIPSCASNLVSCANYLNATTKPPESCCGPLKKAVKDEMPCLCKLYTSPDLLKAFNINITQVLGLPKLCGVHSDTSSCSKSPTASTPAPSSSSKSTGTESGTSSSNKKDSSGTLGRESWIGMSGFVTLLLFGWSIVAL